MISEVISKPLKDIAQNFDRAIKVVMDAKAGEKKAIQHLEEVKEKVPANYA